MTLIYALLMSLLVWKTVHLSNPQNETGINQGANQTSELSNGVQNNTTLLNTTHEERPEDEVPKDYLEIGHLGWFKKVFKPATYIEARDDCRKDGANLLLLNSNARWALANAFLSYSEESNSMWVGIDFTNGRWETHSGIPVEKVKFFNWRDGHPKAGKVGVSIKKPLGAFTSGSASKKKTKHVYICEITSKRQGPINYHDDEL